MLEQPVVKATYNTSKRNWKVYWQRAELKWHGYKPNPEVDSIEDFSHSFRKMSMAASSANGSYQ
jgi:hypothetical protein